MLGSMVDSTGAYPIDSGLTVWQEPDRGVDPRRALRASAGVGLVGGSLAAAYWVWGWGLPCPFLALTGWWCPVCGSTRMGARILQADFFGAIYANPVVFAVLCWWLVAVALWAAEVVQGRRLPGPHRRWSQPQIYGALGLVFGVFTVVRNLF